MRRLALPLVLALLVSCTASSSTGAVGDVTIGGSPPPSSVSPTPSVIPAPATCPKDKDLGGLMRQNTVPGVARAMVPGEPSVLVVCGPGPRAVIQGGRVQGLAAALNGLEQVPPGPWSCPFSYFRQTYGLFFDYPNGEVLLVVVNAGGCQFASNGRTSAYLDASIFKLLGLIR